MQQFRRTAACVLTAACLAVPAALIGAAPAQAQGAAPANVFRVLTLRNGWTNGPFSTSNAAADQVSGIVHLLGAIATTGTNPVPFVLPAAFRPTTTVYVPVDMCNATNGRLIVSPNGTVTVQSETSFANAACFTSLDGATWATSAASFTPLTVANGWTNAPFSTRNAAARTIGGIVYLEGAIATSGTNPVPFTLPAAFRPATTVYVPVDLCNATKGRLIIQHTGVVTVQAETSFANAACFTSLEGVSYSRTTTSFTPLTLVNGWTNAPFGTSNAAVSVNTAGIVQFKGAISGGTANQVFTLPSSTWPANTAYVPVDMCNATNGRLIITANGVVTVQAESSFSNAQCFTSLDGASFAR